MLDYLGVPVGQSVSATRSAILTRRAVCTIACLLTLGGCSSDTAGPNPVSSDGVLWSLTFSWPAANIALTTPSDTVQLVATPRTSTGAVLTNVEAIQYTTVDSAVSVSSTGLVTARYATPAAHVVAHLTVGSITLTDTAVVQVTDVPLPAPLDTLSIQPRLGGLAAARMNLLNLSVVRIPFFATIASGDPATAEICVASSCPRYPLVVHFASSDPSIATIDQTGRVNALHTGHVTFYVSTMAYGVPKFDSLPFVIGYPARAFKTILVDSSHTPHGLYAGSGGPTFLSVSSTYWITNGTADPLEITLPGPAERLYFSGAPAQRIDTLSSSQFVIVQFDSVGTYVLQYRSLNAAISATQQTFAIKNYP